MRQSFAGIVIAVALVISGCGSGEPTLKYPKSYAAWKKNLACIGEPYFNCDYTTKTCLSGRVNVVGQAGFLFVGEVLAEDRRTVIAHVMRQGSYWLNFDTGQTSPSQVPLNAFSVHDDDQPPDFGNSNCVPR